MERKGIFQRKKNENVQIIGYKQNYNDSSENLKLGTNSADSPEDNKNVTSFCLSTKSDYEDMDKSLSFTVSEAQKELLKEIDDILNDVFFWCR